MTIQEPFMLDTGSPEWCQLPINLVAENLIPQDHVARVLIQAMENSDRFIDWVKLDKVNFQLVKYHHFFGLVNNLGSINWSNHVTDEGNLGLTFLQQYDLVFNLTKTTSVSTRLYYLPLNFWVRSFPFLFPYITPVNRLGPYGIFWGHLENGKVKITAVLQGSPVNEAGIVPGTLVSEVNGRPVKQYSPEQLKQLLGFSKAPLTLTYQTPSGKTYTHVFSLETQKE